MNYGRKKSYKVGHRERRQPGRCSESAVSQSNHRRDANQWRHLLRLWHQLKYLDILQGPIW